MSAPPSILFICTANYYRSRFAEMYFNHLAEQSGIPARADSAAFEMARWRTYNPGDLSVHTIKELDRLGVNVPKPYRVPKQFDPAQVAVIDRCIALSASEHRPMAARLFPEVVDQLEFWTVEDVEFESPVSALGRIQENVQKLITALSSSESHS